MMTEERPETKKRDFSGSLEDAADCLRKGYRFLIVAHASPDGDALGCVQGLKQMLEQLGKQAEIYCADRLPARYAFLIENLRSSPEELPAEYLEENGKLTDSCTVVSLDTATLPLMGSAADWIGERVTLKIDHHAMSDPFAEINVRDAGAAACGELLCDLAERLGVLTPAVANSLYMAISSDSGCFCYSSVSAETHRRAAKLLDAGADHDWIDRALFSSRTAGEIRALRMLLNRMQLECGGRVLLLAVDEAVKEEYELSDDDLGALPSFAMTLAGVELAAIVKHRGTDGEKYRVSLRSGPEMAANAIAARLGGGGHLRAAGASVYAENAAEALRQVMAAIEAQEASSAPEDRA